MTTALPVAWLVARAAGLVAFGLLTLSVWLGLNGLPALPLLSLGFLLANGDLIWAQLRNQRLGSDPRGSDPEGV